MSTREDFIVIGCGCIIAALIVASFVVVGFWPTGLVLHEVLSW